MFNPKIKWVFFLMLFLGNSVIALSDTMELAPINPTAGANIVATIEGCRGYSPAEPTNIDVELDGNNIDIRVAMPGWGFAVGWCYEREVEIGILPAGDYEISLYVDDLFPELQAVIEFTVVGVASIPTNSTLGILILILLMVAAAKYARRTNEKTAGK